MAAFYNKTLPQGMGENAETNFTHFGVRDFQGTVFFFFTFKSGLERF